MAKIEIIEIENCLLLPLLSGAAKFALALAYHPGHVIGHKENLD